MACKVQFSDKDTSSGDSSSPQPTSTLPCEDSDTHTINRHKGTSDLKQNEGTEFHCIISDSEASNRETCCLDVHGMQDSYNNLSRTSIDSGCPESGLSPQVSSTSMQLTLDLGEDAEESLKATIKKHSVEFRDSTDWRMLLAHLVRRDLVSPCDIDLLNCDYRTDVDKSNNFYFTTLDKKGSFAYRKLYLALREEKTHAGHVHLVKIMTDELRQ